MAIRILLTGAAGHIGQAFREYTGDRYRLRLGVHQRSKLEQPGTHEVVEFDIADLEACQQACQDMDMVIHLAANVHPASEFYADLLEPNIKGTYNIFRAAADQGCQRVIFTSSTQAVDGYPLDVQVHPDSPVKPTNMYGVTKCFGEAVAHYFSYAEGLSCIVVRIGSFDFSKWVPKPDEYLLSKFLSPRDASHLLVQCVEAQNVRFAIVHGVSNNRFKRLDITSTKELLGYAPQDDAFQVFNINLPYSQRWLESL